ncbi:MAG TPA: hypothetical protein VK997_05725, partial [Deferrisomatales bacterium]|nr:hypothetical protein [Deferrisomatales bacterium]
TVRPEHREAFETLFAGRPAARVGEVTAEPVVSLTGLSGTEVVRAGLDEMKKAWQEPLSGI